MSPKSSHHRRTVRLLNKYRDALVEFAIYGAMGVSDEFYKELKDSVIDCRKKLELHLEPK